MNSKITRSFALAFFLVLPGSDTAAAGPNILLTMSPVIAAGDVTPDPFSFAPKSNVPKTTFVISDTITVTGINRVLPVDFYYLPGVPGGFRCSVSIDNGPFQNYGKVQEGQNLRVRLLSSEYNGESESCTVKIGTMSGTFTVTTSIPPPVRTCASGSQTVVWGGQVWQRCDNGLDYSDPGKADQYCDNLNLGGYYDWVIPDYYQLRSLIVCDNGNIDPDPWQGCAYDRDGNSYGSFTVPTLAAVFEGESTPYWSWMFVPYKGYYWRQDFATGVSEYYGVYMAGKIRCVRRGIP